MYLYIYIHMHASHLFFPPTLLGRAAAFCPDFGGTRGRCVALLPRPLGLALCPHDQRCLAKSSVAERCISNTHTRVAARRSGGWRDCTGRRTSVHEFSLLFHSCCCWLGQAYR